MGEAITQLTSASRLVLATPEAANRQRLEQAIHYGFAKAFNADVHEYYPLLSQLNYRGGDCFLGLRSAADSSLFVEQYTDLSIERYFANTPTRTNIAELGNLYSTCRMATLGHFIIVAQALLDSDCQYLVFTATKQVRALMKLCQVKITELVQASDAIATAKDYGSYYQCSPIVCAVNLQDVIAVIAQNQLYQHIQNDLVYEAKELTECFCYA
ncbi:thermostable hemolysin (plasmid) [Pseudoalteromonas sp. T1lg65]|uniref:thermostable hemolysin n=1 Tax=Pseudoalteromonas sp. T1lg65 TaxID=2077101 RepID=UPI003F7AB430